MGNFQDFYKMDKICTSICPDSEVHILSFCFSPGHVEQPVDIAAIAVTAAHCFQEDFHQPHP